MGTFSVIICILAILAIAVLLFPLHVHGDFRLTLQEGFLRLSFFKWSWTLQRRWKKEELGDTEKKSDSKETATETVAHAPAEKKETKSAPKEVSEKSIDQKTSVSTEVKKEDVVKKTAESASTKSKENEKSFIKLEENPKQKAKEISKERERSKQAEKERAKREKALKKAEKKLKKNEVKDETEDNKDELSDKDFFTLLLQPNMVSLAWKYLKKLLGNTFKLFRFKFTDSFVEGIDTGSPDKNGYLAAVLGSLPSVFPALSGFVFVMNWDGSATLGSYGKFTASINLLRILAWIVVAAYIAARVALLYFWMRRKFKKDSSQFKLSFVRRKIVDFIASED